MTITGSQRPPAKRTRRFACLEETQSGGFAWLVVANRALSYRSSSTIAMRHSSPKRTAAERDIPGDRRQCSSSIVGYLARDYYGLCAIILAALVLHTSDVRMNICYGNVMTHMKTWNFYALNARALGRSGGVPQENFAIYSV